MIDVLYINFDLNPGLDTYSLVFLIQNGLLRDNQIQVKIDGFTNLKFVPNVWNFFGISCSYKKGQAILFLQEFNFNISQPNSKNIELNFPNFQMSKTAQLTLANKTTVPFFQTSTFFVGNLAYLEYAPFFTSQVGTMWMGFMDPNSFSYKGILRQFFFDVYERGQPVDSYGFYRDPVGLVGGCEPLNLTNR